jgi:arginyl-tRNA synthetase
MRRIFKFLGYDIHATNYGDDSGVNVGYNITGHLYYEYPTATEMKYDHYCGKIYEEMRKHATGGSPD